jgi:hypothetical protein
MGKESQRNPPEEKCKKMQKRKESLAKEGEEGKKSLAKEKHKRGMRVTNGVLPKTNIRRGRQLQKEFC